MPRLLVLICALCAASLAGCGTSTDSFASASPRHQRGTTSTENVKTPRPKRVVKPVASANETGPQDGPTRPGGSLIAVDPTAPFTLNLTNSAANRVRRQLVEFSPGARLVVSVEFYENICVGFRYNLVMSQDISASGHPVSDYLLLESQGIELAVPKVSAPYLSGTTLDFYRSRTGEEGFVFKNPNDKISTIPEALISDQEP